MNNLDKDAKVVLFSSNNALLLTAPIINNKFSFNNIYLSDSTNVSFSIQEKNKLKKPQIYADFSPKLCSTNFVGNSPLSFVSNSPRDVLKLERIFDFIGSFSSDSEQIVWKIYPPR